MGNYSIKANLLKIKGAFVTNLKGKTATRRCLVIDIDESGMFLGEKGLHPLQSQAQQIQGQLDGASVCENMDDLPF